MESTNRQVRNSLKVTLIGGMIAAMLFTVVAVNVVFVIVSHNNAKDAAARVYQNIASSIANTAANKIDDIHSKLSSYSQIGELANPATPIEERVAASRRASSALGNDITIKLTDLDGMELVMPGEAEINLSDRAYIQAALNGNTFVTPPFFSAVVNRMVLVIAQPLRWDGQIVGTIFMLLPGDFLNEAIESSKIGTEGYACAFDASGSMISHSDIISILERGENQYLELAKTDKSYKGWADAITYAQSAKNGTVTFRGINNEKMLAGFSTTPQGWIVFAVSTVSDILSDTNQAILIAALISLFCIIVVIPVIIRVITVRLIRPITETARFFNQAATTGQIICSDEVNRMFNYYKQSSDEIGQLITDCDRYMDSIIKVSEELANVAEGNLAVDVSVLSDKDTIGLSLKKVVDNLNSMFNDINDSAAQVTSSSAQIADGSGALASGSTEQAATLQQLSASITEIASKTKDNAARTAEASDLAHTIMQNAEKGSRQMDEMMNAVKEINDASANINKVIKVIDDIAFQTNILALNAAVEAARAGQHGKGFAVVAEEVRNLASKSAEAAKNTSGLIANSMEKAELGSRIAQETAASLNEIVSGINKSDTIIAEIAESSSEQTAAIGQINDAVGGITRVVQQNSATAQQSAAASEEMSGQALVLEELISQFKLK